jgi:hypothetical protein
LSIVFGFRNWQERCDVFVVGSLIFSLLLNPHNIFFVTGSKSPESGVRNWIPSVILSFVNNLDDGLSHVIGGNTNDFVISTSEVHHIIFKISSSDWSFDNLNVSNSIFEEKFLDYRLGETNFSCGKFKH